MEAKESRRRMARPSYAKKQELSDDLVERVRRTKERVSKNFGAFVAEMNLRNCDLIKMFSPFIADHPKASKLLSGERNVSIELLAAMHYLCDIDLNEFIAGDKKNPPVMTPEIQKAFLNLNPEIQKAFLNLFDAIMRCQKG